MQPAAGDSGTALGGALHVAPVARRARAADAGRRPRPRLDRRRDRGVAAHRARCRSSARDDIADAVAEVLADNGVVAWFQGRSEYGPRALGHRSLLAHPGHARNLERLNDVKGREQFRPVAPMVLAERAAEIFSRGPLPSPTCSSCTTSRPSGATASRPSSTSTAPRGSRPSTAARSRWSPRMLDCFERRTGLPRRRQHQPEHRRPADGGRPARCAWSASAPRRSTCWRSAPSWSGGRCGWLHDRVPAAGDGRRPDASVGRPSDRPARRSLRRGAAPVPRSSCRRPSLAPHRCPAPACPAVHRPRVVATGGRGPAAARNRGWRAARTEWVAFLDDDVAVSPTWSADLARRPRRPAAGRRREPGPGRGPAARRPAADRLGARHRRPGHGAAGSPPTWPTGARRCRPSGGFDERFPRAYREDADLALRLIAHRSSSCGRAGAT